MNADYVERCVTQLIIEAPEIVFAILSMCGVEFVPVGALRGGDMDREEVKERINEFGEFTTFWVAWLLTGARCSATFLSHGAEPGSTKHAIWILVGVLAALFVGSSLYMLARKGCAWYCNLPLLFLVVLRAVPLLFVMSTLWVHLGRE